MNLREYFFSKATIEYTDHTYDWVNELFENTTIECYQIYHFIMIYSDGGKHINHIINKMKTIGKDITVPLYIEDEGITKWISQFNLNELIFIGI